MADSRGEAAENIHKTDLKHLVTEGKHVLRRLMGHVKRTEKSA